MEIEEWNLRNANFIDEWRWVGVIEAIGFWRSGML